MGSPRLFRCVVVVVCAFHIFTVPPVFCEQGAFIDIDQIIMDQQAVDVFESPLDDVDPFVFFAESLQSKTVLCLCCARIDSCIPSTSSADVHLCRGCAYAALSHQQAELYAQFASSL